MIVYVLHYAETMAERDPVAAAAQKYKPIQSAVPGTTLGPIQINAFLGGEVTTFRFYSFSIYLPPVDMLLKRIYLITTEAV